MRFIGNLFLADADQILGTANHAGQCSTNLNMRHTSHGLELEHEIECRNLKRADIGHAQHFGNAFNRWTRQPSLLLLGTPQQRNNRRLLTPLWVFLNLRFGPCLVRRGKGKAFGLVVVKTA